MQSFKAQSVEDIFTLDNIKDNNEKQFWKKVEKNPK